MFNSEKHLVTPAIIMFSIGILCISLSFVNDLF